jgi:hypothetical protein
VVAAIERRAQAALGPGRYVTRDNSNDVYFEPGMYERVAAAPAALEAVLHGLTDVPGILRAFASGDLRDVARQTDPIARAAALSYVPGRSGDVILVPKPGWMFIPASTTTAPTSATNHGSSSPDDQRVPMLFMGRGIKPGRYTQPATPADVAPTLAAICGVTMPAAEGRVLRAALR